jgi:polyferredoxin
MDKIGRPKGLIAYDTGRNRKGVAEGKKPVFKIVRARTILYGFLVTAISGIMIYGLITRSTLDLNTLRDRSPTFVRLSDGAVRNGYTLKIINKATKSRDLRVTVKGIEGITIKAVGLDSNGKSIVVHAKPDKVRVIKMYVTVPKDVVRTLKESAPIAILIEDEDGSERTVNRTVFLSGKR